MTSMAVAERELFVALGLWRCCSGSIVVNSGYGQVGGGGLGVCF